MTSFFNDPEAQRRYQERFGKPSYADDKPLYADREAQAKYEASGFRETPSLRQDQTTWNQTLRARRAPEVDTTARGIVFAEPSASYSRLSERLKQRQSGPVGGITWDTDDPNAGLGL